MSSSRAPVPEKRFSYESLSDVRGAGVIGTGIRSVNLAPHPFKDHEIGVKTGVGLASLQVGEARDLIRDALERQPAAVRTLVDRLSPVIERKVAATLWRRTPGRDVRQEVRDMTQAVFVSLFEDDAKALRAWDPDRGASLESFVSLLAHRQVISILR